MPRRRIFSPCSRAKGLGNASGPPSVPERRRVSPRVFAFFSSDPESFAPLRHLLSRAACPLLWCEICSPLAPRRKGTDPTPRLASTWPLPSCLIPPLPRRFTRSSRACCGGSANGRRRSRPADRALAADSKNFLALIFTAGAVESCRAGAKPARPSAWRRKSKPHREFHSAAHPRALQPGGCRAAANRARSVRCDANQRAVAFHAPRAYRGTGRVAAGLRRRLLRRLHCDR